jgi:hypothetical protein
MYRSRVVFPVDPVLPQKVHPSETILDGSRAGQVATRLKLPSGVRRI